MEVTWLGQAGLLFEINDTKIMIDPYLSNSVERINPNNYRRVAVDENLFAIKPDIMIFTHKHLDHYDPETVNRFIKTDSGVTVLAPSSVWNDIRKLGGNNNYVQFDCYTSWSERSLCFTAVKAVHSDEYAIGVVIDDGDRKWYVTGDTLYNEEIFRGIPRDIYALFLPINGVGNNMNMTDAARFAERIGAKKVVPIHIGMFDDIDAELFVCENRVVPKIYQVIDV